MILNQYRINVVDFTNTFISQFVTFLRRKKHLAFIPVIFFNAAFGQNESLFEITQQSASWRVEKNRIENIKKENFNFYEDDLYICSKSCAGEFGGRVRFKNKLTGNESYIKATCPLIINKIDRNYYLSNTIRHLAGSSSVLQISNPDSLNEVEIYQSIYPWDFLPNKIVEELLDTTGVIILLSFPYDKQLFHIISDYSEIYLAKIENKSIEKITTLSNQYPFTNTTEIIITNHNHFIVPLRWKRNKGHLDVVDNKIMVITYK